MLPTGTRDLCRWIDYSVATWINALGTEYMYILARQPVLLFSVVVLVPEEYDPCKPAQPGYE